MQDIHKKAKQFHKWWIYIGGRRIFFCKFDFCCTWVGAAYAKYVCNRSMDRFLRESDDAKLRIHLNECWGWLCGVGIMIFHWFSWTFLEPKSFSCLTTFPPSWECRDIQLAGWSGDRVYGIGTNVVFNFSLFKLTSKPSKKFYNDFQYLSSLVDKKGGIYSPTTNHLAVGLTVCLGTGGGPKIPVHWLIGGLSNRKLKHMIVPCLSLNGCFYPKNCCYGK
jgi:hypothetical protein